MEWKFLKDPSAAGWYAVLVCYDPQEGVFPAGAYWDGEKWSRKAVHGFGEKCETEKEAEELAYANDPDA